jgi:hypothetical protein
MMSGLRKKIEAWLCQRGIEHSQAQWLILFQTLLSFISTIGLVLAGQGGFGLGFGVGAFLATMNFFVLAKIVPQLIQSQKGSVFALLASFYFRLFLTAIALFLAIVWAGLSPIAVLAGLSTILVTFMVWTGKYIVTQQHKEA